MKRTGERESAPGRFFSWIVFLFFRRRGLLTDVMMDGCRETGGVSTVMDVHSEGAVS